MKIDIGKAVKAFKDLWMKEEFGWTHTPSSDCGDLEYWRKRYPVFDVYISHYGNNLFDITVLWGQSAALIYESEKIQSDAATMKSYGDKIIQEFIMEFELSPTRPPNEIRFKQITSSKDKEGGPVVYGLTEEGTVYISSGYEGWTTVPMIRTGQ